MVRLAQNRTILKEKLHEALVSVVPITLIVLLLTLTVAPVPSGTLLAFLCGAVLLIIGMGLFTLGADMAMTPIGERVGATITKSKKLWIIIVIGFVMGFMITISEPDLQVLAGQVTSVPNWILIGTVAAGVGVFLVIALLRIVVGIPLKYLLIGFYIIVFVLANFVPPEFIPVSFDSGGVTTGPMTVPFIMALGVGVSSIRSDKHAGDDSFGLVALSSIGPILAMMILGMVYKPGAADYAENAVPIIETSTDITRLFGEELPHYIGEVALALAPIFIFFIIFQVVSLKMKKRPFMRIVIGLVYTYVGLVLFLTGVNVGFLPVGNYLGQQIASLSYNWIIIPIGMLIGYFIITAEPAVHVLNKQVAEMTAGAIPEKAMNLSLAIGVSIAVGLSMMRVLTGLNIMWILIPGYAIALIMTFFTPTIFSSIAFDSGGVASGPMTATFLLPFAMGASETLGGNVVTDAFGIVAMVAMIPLITIQVLGLVYKYVLKKDDEAHVEDQQSLEADDDTEIIEL